MFGTSLGRRKENPKSHPTRQVWRLRKRVSSGFRRGGRKVKNPLIFFQKRPPSFRGGGEGFMRTFKSLPQNSFRRPEGESRSPSAPACFPSSSWGGPHREGPAPARRENGALGRAAFTEKLRNKPWRRARPAPS